jgi:two-component system sensor kinase FixL
MQPTTDPSQDPGRNTVSEARLLGVLDTAEDGIVVVDEAACILVFNRACERMFGYAAEEVVGRPLKTIIPGGPALEGDPEPRRALGPGREVRGLHRDGTLFPLDLSIGEAQTPEGRQFVGILRDLTARKDAERHLNELQADLIRLTRISALDEMGSALAHELNQPLTAILLYLQAVGREFGRAREAGHTPEADDRANAILEKARREAQRAGSIIQRIRSLVEKRAPERKSVELNVLVDDAVDLTMIGQDRSVRVVRDYAPGLPPVEVDAVQIQQVAVNILRNAVEAVRGRERPQVVVSTRLDDRHLLLAIEDNGPGIPQERQADLFQAFKTGKRSGMGLGLAISRTIAQNHGGELLVDPGGDGRGARFVVRLPLRAPDTSDRFAADGG